MNQEELRRRFLKRPAQIHSLFSWSSLVFSSLSFASVSPVMKFANAEGGIAPRVFGSWELQASLVLVSVFFIAELWHHYRSTGKEGKSNDGFTRKIVVYALGAGACEGLFEVLRASSLVYTTALRAALFVSLSPFVNTIASLVRGVKPSKGELGGIPLCFAGMVVSLGGLSAFSQGDSTCKNCYFGDAMAFLACIFMMLIPHFASAAREKQTPVQLGFFSCVSTTLITCAFTVALDGAHPFGTSRDGLLGWANVRDSLSNFVVVFAVIGMLAKLSLDYALKYIRPDIVLLSTLLDVPLTGTIAWALGVDSLPDRSTWIGGCLILLGLVLVVRYSCSSHREETEDAERLMHGDHISETKE